MIGRLLALVAALICVAASPSYADDFSRGLVVGKIQASTITASCHAVGCALSVPNVPGATYQWFNGGVAVSGATSNSYTPTSAGDISVTITLNRQTVSSAITITGTPAATATVGQAYSFSPTISGGSGSGYSVAFTGSYPPGITKDSATGNLGGSPTTAGTYSGLGETASDSLGNHASLTPFQLTVASASVSTCPNGTTWADDCQGAPVDGEVYFPNFFTAPATNYVYQTGVARQNNQAAYNPAVLNGWNAAGVQFPVGDSPSEVAQAGGWKTNIAGISAETAGKCTYSANGGGINANGPQIDCNHLTADIDIENYDLSPSGPAGHCVPIVFHTDVPVNVKFKNIRWVADSNCSTVSASGTGYAGLGFLGYTVAQTYYVGYACISSQVQGSGGVITGGYVYSAGGQNVNWTINSSAGADCAAGFTEYALADNVTGVQTLGSSTSQVTIGEATNTVYFTSMTGTVVTGQSIVDSISGASVTSCSPTCSGAGTTVTTSGSSSSGLMYDPPGTTFYSGKATLGFVVFSGAATSIDFERIKLDCKDTDPATAIPMDPFSFKATGTVTIKYTGNLRCGRGSVNAAKLDAEANYVENFGRNEISSHREWILPSATLVDQTYLNNVFLTTADEAPSGTAPIFLTTTSSTTLNAVVKYNISVSNAYKNAGGYVYATNDGALLHIQDSTYGNISITTNLTDWGGASLFCMADPQSRGLASWLSGNINLPNGHIQSAWGDCQ